MTPDSNYSRALTQLEQDVLDMCFDFGGGASRMLSKHLPEISDIELRVATARLCELGFLRREKGSIVFGGTMFDDDIWSVTSAGRAHVSPGE